MKAKLSETEGRVGGLSPQLPLLASKYSRLFPQWFNGAQVVQGSGQFTPPAPGGITGPFGRQTPETTKP
jgi:hypothetical protein